MEDFMECLRAIQARSTRLLEMDAEIARAEDAGRFGECTLLYMEQEENLRALLQSSNRVRELSRIASSTERFREG